VELHGRSVTKSSLRAEWVVGGAPVRRDYAVNRGGEGRSSAGVTRPERRVKITQRRRVRRDAQKERRGTPPPCVHERVRRRLKGMELRHFLHVQQGRQWKIDRGICNDSKGRELLEGRLELIETAGVAVLALVCSCALGALSTAEGLNAPSRSG